MISACAGRPFLPNRPCWRPLQTTSSFFVTVTVMGQESMRCGTTSASACTDRMAALAALNSCPPPSQFCVARAEG